jgi:hypothetical protein
VLDLVTRRAGGQAKDSIVTRGRGLRARRYGCGFRPPFRAYFEQQVGPDGATHGGSPETVALEIAETMKVLGAPPFRSKVRNGWPSLDTLMRNIELYGARLVLLVREMLA